LEAFKSRYTSVDDETCRFILGRSIFKGYEGLGERSMFAVFTKELRSYFIGSTGYVFIGVFLLISGIFFSSDNIVAGSASYSTVLSETTFMFLILVPAITMKLLAEERSQKTEQLLLTSPLGLWEIVIGKYLATVSLFLITLLITLIYPIILNFYTKIPIGETAAAYLGFFMLGLVFISMGLFISSLTENQIAAGIITFGVLLMIWMLELIQQGLPTGKTAGAIFLGILIVIFSLLVYFFTRNIFISCFIVLLGGIASVFAFIYKANIFEGFIQKFFGWFSLLRKYESFNMGIVDLASLIYYSTFSFAFVFFTVIFINKRRWS
jgi:ABC-2 type transport system permease protein